MKQFDYKFTAWSGKRPGEVAINMPEVAAIGNEGWEMVNFAIIPTPLGTIQFFAVFKREKTEQIV